MADTPEGTSTPMSTADILKGFAAIREAGPAPEETAVDAAPTDEAEAPAEVTPEPETDVPEGEAEGAPVKARFKIGDEELTEEDILEARKSGLRQADYTKKTTELSEKSRKLEQERASEREETLKRWQALEDAVASVTPKEPDWGALQAQIRAGTLSQEDYNLAAAEWVRIDQERKAIAAERQKAEEAVKADQQKANEAQAQRNMERVLELIPTWKDVGVRQKDFGAMVAYAQELGVDERMLQTLPPEGFRMLKDAVAYHTLQSNASKPKVVKVDGSALKPGAADSVKPKASEVETSLRRVAQTHTDDDAVAAFRALRKAGAY